MSYKNNQNTQDKAKELLQKFENGIKNVLNSERYKAFLKLQSQFHSYSFRNQILIFLQKPDATRVAGYKAWNKFERHVMKGEKGISILAPNTYKYEKEIDKLDPKTKKPIKDPITGENQKEKVIMQGLNFRKVTVFDVKQTEGKELPSICDELQGNSLNSENIIKAIKKISEVPIVEKEIQSGAKGYYSRAENLIAINKGMSLDQTAKTLIHEYAHSQLHNTDSAALLDRATKEVQAESVAYIVANRFGVDTSEYSFDYLANWSSGKELKELNESFGLIQKTANNMIIRMEDPLNKELELQHSPVKVAVEKHIKDHVEESVLIADNEPLPYSYTKCELSQKEIEAENQSEKVTPISTRDKVLDTYKKDFPGIKHVLTSTVKTIDILNKESGHTLSIKEIKNIYNKLGKKIENNNYNNEDMKKFKSLSEVVEDLNHSKLVEKQIQATQKKYMEKSIDMVQ